MKTFTYSDLNRTPGEILDIALVEPVMLTKRGKGKLVVMSAVQYEVLAFGPAFSMDNLPEALREAILETLDKSIEDIEAESDFTLKAELKSTLSVAAE
jgi:prevent-host-death family protein